MHDMLDKDTLRKTARNPAKSKERHRVERATHNMQQDSNASDRGIHAVRTKTSTFLRIRSVLITKSSYKTGQNIAQLEYRMDQWSWITKYIPVATATKYPTICLECYFTKQQLQNLTSIYI